MSSRLWLIDGTAYVLKYAFSMPDSWHNSKGEGNGALYGWSRFLINLLRQENPTHIAVAFDESLGTGFRHRLYPHYKSNRVMAKGDLYRQLQEAKTIAELLGFPVFASDEYEADDLLASLAKVARQQSIPVTVVSRDKDLGQLLFCSDDYLWDWNTSAAKTKTLNPETFKKRYGIEPVRFNEYLALAGDSVDCIPGVSGVGDKSSIILLNKFSSLEDIYNNIDKVLTIGLRGAKRIQHQLIFCQQQAFLSRELATLITDIPLVNTMEDLIPVNNKPNIITEYFSEAGLGAIINDAINVLSNKAMSINKKGAL